MSSTDPSDPRPDAQVEAEEANAAEEVREITHGDGSRDAEAESAAEYEKAGISGAPGSEVAAGRGVVVHTDEGTAAAGKGATGKTGKSG